jgi:hypothetical protein
MTSHTFAVLASHHRVHQPISWTLEQAGGDPVMLQRLRHSAGALVGLYCWSLDYRPHAGEGLSPFYRSGLAVVDDFGSLVPVGRA